MSMSVTVWRVPLFAVIFDFRKRDEAMSFLLTTIVSILVFGFVILFHEAGHFFTAKKCGIQVNEFSIGMGPTLFKRTKDGTQYSIRALPIGGYVSMEGENGEEEEAIDIIPLDVKSGKAFSEVSVTKRMLVVAAGALMNLVLGFLVMLILISSQDAITSKTIYKFSDGALCHETGLQTEDTILAVNGRHAFVPNDIIYELQRSPDYKANFTVKRNGQTVEVPNVRFDTVVQPDGRTTMQIGFVVYGIEKTPLNVLKEAGNWVLYYTRLVFRSLTDLVTGRVSVNELSGPVGIVSVLNQAVGMGLDEILSIMVLLTVNLGVFNLLPIPALDGGKLVLLAVEGMTHKRVPPKAEMAINAVGMVFLLGLMLFATFNDILRLI